MLPISPSRAEQASKRLCGWTARIKAAPRGVRSGRLERVSGLMLEVTGLPMTIGNRAAVASGSGWVECECVGCDRLFHTVCLIDRRKKVLWDRNAGVLHVYC